ncbi:MAG: hypothetical protein ACKV22_18160 [Bryobacteraceae bacterium]
MVPDLFWAEVGNISWESVRLGRISGRMMLAVASGRPLITAAERLVNAVGTRLPVRWLGSVV